MSAGLVKSPMGKGLIEREEGGRRKVRGGGEMRERGGQSQWKTGQEAEGRFGRACGLAR